MRTTIAILAAIALAYATAPAHAQTYSKCRTINGTIIVVAGFTCPAGTIWVGNA